MSSPPTKEASSWGGALSRWFAVHLLVAVVAAMPALPAKAATQRAIILEISDAIGPAIADYIIGELRAADTTQTGLIVLRMNTPGGLDSSMREIVSAILASPVPVATYVAPVRAQQVLAPTSRMPALSWAWPLARILARPHRYSWECLPSSRGKGPNNPPHKKMARRREP